MSILFCPERLECSINKTEIKRCRFHLGFNFVPFRKFRPNSGQNVSVLFRMFRFGYIKNHLIFYLTHDRCHWHLIKWADIVAWKVKLEFYRSNYLPWNVIARCGINFKATGWNSFADFNDVGYWIWELRFDFWEFGFGCPLRLYMTTCYIYIYILKLKIYIL